MSWKLCATASKQAVEAALESRERHSDWDEDIVLTGFEADPEEPDSWRLEAYTPTKPTPAQRKAVKALFGEPPPRFAAEQLPDSDWVAESQKGMDPIRAGRFRVRTPDHAQSGEPGVTEFCIPAAQAFGTGQHATTAGCLAMLDHMKRQGIVARHVADIGTGTGLLAFAALDLWPHACATASDIDPVCLPAVEENAALNHVALGTLAGELAMVIADGMDDDLIVERGPYDLLIANILAGPLIDLAPAFAQSVAARGSILLSGLLATQERLVRAAYLRAGFRLHARIVEGDWAILWLRHRFTGLIRPASLRRAGKALAATLAALLAAIALFLLAAWIGSAIPRNPAAAPVTDPVADGIEIMVESNGDHTGIVMPVITPVKDWRAVFPSAGEPRGDGQIPTHISVGWGEREVFLHVPTWADLRVATVLRILVRGGHPVMRVSHYVRPIPDVNHRPVTISRGGLRPGMATAIEASLAPPGPDGTRAKLVGTNPEDAYYDARGHYNAVTTCNSWVADRIADAGIQVGWWTPFAGGVMKWIEKPAQG